MRLTNRSTSLSISKSTPVDSINISELYAYKQLNVSPQKLIGPNNERFSALQFIRDSITDNQIIASSYAIVVDSTSPYVHSNTSDFMMTLKITDQSIFPNVAIITIFSRAQKDLIKIAGIGDIIRLENIPFKIHKGNLSATLSASGKSGKFFVFALEDESLVPYACYSGKFNQISEHTHLLENLRKWVVHQFQNALPSNLHNTTRLSETISKVESDIVVRVYGVYKMGIKNDPHVIICYDENAVSQLVIPVDKERLKKWVLPGSCVRLRSVIFEGGRVFLTYYSDIQIIPEWMSLCSIGMVSKKEQEMQQLAEAYITTETKKLRTIVSQNMKSAPIISYSRLSSLQHGYDCRIEGYVVKTSPNNPRSVIGMMCTSCGKRTDLDFCGVCNLETEVRCDLEFYVWDGSEHEDNVVKLQVLEENCEKFMKNIEWAKLKEMLLNPDSLVEFGVRVSENFYEIIETSISSN